jgi:hypothetical protein
MMQVEAVLPMQLGFSLAIARSAATRVTLGSSAGPVPERGGCAAPGGSSGDDAEDLIANRGIEGSRKQFVDLQAAIQTAVRKRDGGIVVGDETPTRRRLAASEKATNITVTELRPSF